MYQKLRPKLLKHIVLMTVIATLVFSQAIPAFAATTETVPSWAANEIQTWKDLGLLKGDQNGLYHPNDNLTRAEFLTFVNRVFNFTDQSSTAFSDVPKTAWYAAEIAKAYEAGITTGVGNGKMAPLNTITREEVASILGRAFYVTGTGSSGNNFPDDGQISSWAKQAAYAMRDTGYITGDASGAFMPKKNATRAEVVKMINNVMGKLISTDGTYSGITGRNVVVNTSGTTLSDLNITGDLYITCGAGQGSLVIKNAKVTGTIFISGGGSVTIENSTIGNVAVDKPKGAATIALTGTTVSGSLTADSQAEIDMTGSKISALTIDGKADGSAVRLDSASSLNTFTANAKVGVKGSGSIANAVINANNVSIEQTPANIKLNADSAVVGGKTIKGDSASVPAAGGNGGGGSGGYVPPVSYDTEIFDYDTVSSSFSDNGAEGLVKQYIGFLQDQTYTPGIANKNTYMPNFTNAITFVNADFSVHPSLFPALRDVNTSVLDNSRKNLWIGTNSGVIKIQLSDMTKTVYDDSKDLKDNKVLLLISDGGTGVYAITETGVSHIKI
jgi:S-layer homology domain.